MFCMKKNPSSKCTTVKAVFRAFAWVKVATTHYKNIMFQVLHYSIRMYCQKNVLEYQVSFFRITPLKMLYDTERCDDVGVGAHLNTLYRDGWFNLLRLSHFISSSVVLYVKPTCKNLSYQKYLMEKKVQHFPLKWVETRIIQVKYL